ncbi:MAG: anaerobic sulfatase maturase [Bryobacteraceae bacterium]
MASTALGFHVMAKPTGAACNLDCSYCFFLSKQSLYPGSSFRMPDAVMESYVRQLADIGRAGEVTIAWQGGEPTLMGLEFYRRAIAVAQRYRKPANSIRQTLQTNGILLDSRWCEFLRENRFLVGISLDGPAALHDIYRKDKAGRGTWERVIRAVHLMQKERVEFNILCAVNSANADHPLEVYRYFRDELQCRYLQFIPIVERAEDSSPNLGETGSPVTDRSVTPVQYGQFLIRIFDEWVRHDVGKIFIQSIDAILATWVYGISSLCVFRPSCGDALALEHNGDLYSCDHFVDPDHRLGNILERPLYDLVTSVSQREFGTDKRDKLPRFCRNCAYLFECNGECPKNRFVAAPDGEPGLNYLCPGLKAYFAHTDPYMRTMANLVRQGRPAASIMEFLSLQDAYKDSATVVGRNNPCPCGSGLKYKRCHGRAH